MPIRNMADIMDEEEESKSKEERKRKRDAKARKKIEKVRVWRAARRRAGVCALATLVPTRSDHRPALAASLLARVRARPNQTRASPAPYPPRPTPAVFHAVARVGVALT